MSVLMAATNNSPIHSANMPPLALRISRGSEELATEDSIPDL